MHLGKVRRMDIRFDETPVSSHERECRAGLAMLGLMRETASGVGDLKIRVLGSLRSLADIAYCLPVRTKTREACGLRARNEAASPV